MYRRLHINEEVLDACVADVFYVSFTDELQDYNVKEQQCFEHLQQSKEKPQHRQRSFGSKRQQQQQKVEGKSVDCVCVRVCVLYVCVCCMCAHVCVCVSMHEWTCEYPMFTCCVA